MRTRAVCVGAAALGMFAAGAPGQTINDGNFDALAIGTPPDNATPAGAWQFPANYIAMVLGEVLPTNYSIVATGPVPGNSLAMNVNSATANIHLTNILPAIINEVPGRTIRVGFRVFVPDFGPALPWGGGSIYVGADMGGGGFNNGTDRGPQLTWFPNGTITHAHLVAGVVTNTVIVPVWVPAVWQEVRLDVRLDTDNFDAYWGPAGGPLAQVGTNLAFRSGTLNKIDRFSFAHFGATVALNNALYDDITIEIIDTCYPDCNGVGGLTIADFGCFQTKFVAGDPYADCNGVGGLTIADFGCFQTKFVAGCP